MNFHTLRQTWFENPFCDLYLIEATIYKTKWSPHRGEVKVVRNIPLWFNGRKRNILYELDGKPALDLYKKYLGEQAKGFPATGLLFSLSLRLKNKDAGLVRTILPVN